MARHDDDGFEAHPAPPRRPSSTADDGRDDDRGQRRGHGDEDGYDFVKRDPPHSAVGIASLVVAVVAGIGLLALFILVAVMEDNGDWDEDSPTAAVMMAFMASGFALTLTGLGLGLAGVLQKDRHKLFAVLGLAANALVLLGSLGLACVGALSELGGN